MNQSFGFHINAIRSVRKISLPALSTSTGIAEEILKKLEDGTMHASKDQVFALANFFGVTECEFLRLNHAGRVALETAELPHNALSTKAQKAILSKNAPLHSKRIENMKRDLRFLETCHLNVKLHLPTPALRPFIHSIVYCKDHSLGHPFERSLPDGTSQLQIVIGEGSRDVVSQSGKQVKSFSRAWVMGMNDKPVTYRLSEEQGVIYVRFRPAGLYAFSKIHQGELKNLVVDAEIVFGPTLEILWHALAGCHLPQQMISHVEDYFLNKVQDVVTEPAMLTYMLDHIHSPLTQLANKTGYSSKYLTRTFQKYVGVGPKTFQRIQRFHAAVCNLNHLTGSVDWAEIVFQRGYHDQAHFIKDFRYFSGFSPQNYLALGASCARYLHTPHLPEHL